MPMPPVSRELVELAQEMPAETGTELNENEVDWGEEDVACVEAELLSKLRPHWGWTLSFAGWREIPGNPTLEPGDPAGGLAAEVCGRIREWKRLPRPQGLSELLDRSMHGCPTSSVEDEV